MTSPSSLRMVGGCHCAVIRLELTWPQSSGDLPSRACSCTFCRKHGGNWTSNTKASLTIEIADSSLVSIYRFGSESASFYICSRCGVSPLVTSEIDGKLYAVVNVNTLENFGELIVSEKNSNFEGETLRSRLERRKANWIPDVRIESTNRQHE